jgi:hypothetical protein
LAGPIAAPDPASWRFDHIQRLRPVRSLAVPEPKTVKNRVHVDLATIMDVA